MYICEGKFVKETCQEKLARPYRGYASYVFDNTDANRNSIQNIFQKKFPKISLLKLKKGIKVRVTFLYKSL